MVHLLALLLLAAAAHADPAGVPGSSANTGGGFADTNGVAVIRNADDLQEAISRRRDFAPLDVTGHVHFTRSPQTWVFALEMDGRRFYAIRQGDEGEKNVHLSIGDRIRLTGYISGYKRLTDELVVKCLSLEVLAHDPVGEPPLVTGPEIASRENDLRLVRAVGEVVDAFRDQENKTWFYVYIRSNGALFIATYLSDGRDPVVLSNLLGARVQVEGCCAPLRPGQCGARRMVLVGPEKIRILEPPPFWTPAKFLGIIGVLAIALLGCFFWNRSINRRAEKRGTELAAERIAHAMSEMKVYERTHLAVELHDSLSQTLSGIALQINAVKKCGHTDPARADRHLEIASRTLKSCRDELRNCLWDLRNDTLDDGDMNAAIRRTLEPHVGDAELAVRFNIPRERFTDSACHAILKIVRELAVNAVRHGHAGKVLVAGTIEDSWLKFSVRDNGGGFDPATAPGIADGHFGLQGVRERVEAFEGEMSVESASGNGTRVEISIRLPEGAEA